MKYFFTVVLFLCAIPVLAQDGVHRTKCITLNDNYKADGGSFVIQKNIGNSKVELPAITDIKGKPLPDGFIANNESITPTICKRKGMEKSSDFENSYEICGIRVNLTHKDGSSMVILSDFNIKEDACTINLPSGFFHSVRSLLIKGFEEEERLKAEQEDNKVGHIYLYNDKGRKVIKRIQCGSESDNFLHVPGANH